MNELQQYIVQCAVKKAFGISEQFLQEKIEGKCSKNSHSESLNIESEEEALNLLQRSSSLLVDCLNQIIEDLGDEIASVGNQLHSDKIFIAQDFEKRLKKKVDSGDEQEVRFLRAEVERSISLLLSDMWTRVKKCESIPKKGKPLLFAQTRIKAVEVALAELKETLPLYMDSIVLLSRIELYFGEFDQAKDTVREAQEKLKELFPAQNRMFTLTDEVYWVEKPNEYVDRLFELEHKIEDLQGCKQMLLK